ncbi:hypothetical protein C8Q78DRAFT_995345 [Trametes maxima]|nr:hypothetical protein C8Q78DRAFT_995345 [Trametes maxima]
MDYIEGPMLAQLWPMLSTRRKLLVAFTLRRYVRQLCHCLKVPAWVPPGLLCADGSHRMVLNIKNMPQDDPVWADLFDNPELLILTHQDINLQNIIVDKEGCLWLIDWAWVGYYLVWFEYLATRAQSKDPVISGTNDKLWKSMVPFICQAQAHDGLWGSWARRGSWVFWLFADGCGIEECARVALQWMPTEAWPSQRMAVVNELDRENRHREQDNIIGSVVYFDIHVSMETFNEHTQVGTHNSSCHGHCTTHATGGPTRERELETANNTEMPMVMNTSTQHIQATQQIQANAMSTASRRGFPAMSMIQCTWAWDHVMDELVRGIDSSTNEEQCEEDEESNELECERGEVSVVIVVIAPVNDVYAANGGVLVSQWQAHLAPQPHSPTLPTLPTSASHCPVHTVHTVHTQNKGGVQATCSKEQCEDRGDEKLHDNGIVETVAIVEWVSGREADGGCSGGMSQ